MSDLQNRAENLISCIISGCEEISGLNKGKISRDNFKIEAERDKKWILLSVKNSEQDKFTDKEKQQIQEINMDIKRACFNCLKHTKNAKFNRMNDYEPSTSALRYIQVKYHGSGDPWRLCLSNGRSI